jgi:sugar O-acyltransferase (sialic acid O-acetyltransferase NeuD family)
MDKQRKLIIIGDSAFAEIAFEYFQHDSEYEVVAFCVEQPFLKRDSLFGLPVIALEEMEKRYRPDEHSFYAANVYTQRNQLRTRLCQTVKQKGYKPASYISPHAFVWRNCKIGEHCFIFENNVVQPFVTIGDNVVLWSGNHIGHHSTIEDNCFISSHVVVSGFCRIGRNCFMGVNSTVANNISIGNDCVIGAGALILADIEDGQTAVGMWKKRKESSQS